MAMGSSKGKEKLLFLTPDDLPQGAAMPFYDKLNAVLREAGFDEFVAGVCAPFYHRSLGRPSLPPEVYFRMLLLGYLLGINSERGIAMQASDNLSLREFLGYELYERTPDHSTLARTRQRLSLEAHEAVFRWVVGQLRGAGLAPGEELAVDATTLQANAALQGLQRKADGAAYGEYVRQLAEAAGESVGSREELQSFDRQRAGKKLSNAEWESGADPDARVARMKDGGTDMAYKAEHAVDLESGALLADTGDSQSLPETLEAVEQTQEEAVEAVVLDRGYHSDETLERLEGAGVESYVPEPRRRGKRQWKGKAAAQARHVANRERAGSARGRELARLRTEKVERSMAHMYGTGAMRRVWLRGCNNVRKRLLVHACGYNLGLWMRHLTGVGTPRSLQGRAAQARLVPNWPFQSPNRGRFRRFAGLGLKFRRKRWSTAERAPGFPAIATIPICRPRRKTRV